MKCLLFVCEWIDADEKERTAMKWRLEERFSLVFVPKKEELYGHKHGTICNNKVKVRLGLGKLF